MVSHLTVLLRQKPIESAIEALRFRADGNYPQGGEQSFNDLHLYQIADELESLLQYIQYKENV